MLLAKSSGFRFRSIVECRILFLDFMEPTYKSLPIVRVDKDEHKFVVEYENRLYRINQLKYQFDECGRETLPCIITFNDNSVWVGLNYEVLMREHYKEGDNVVFNIKSITGSNLRLEDDLGFSTYIENTQSLNPSITKRITCRIISIKGQNPKVEYVGTLKEEDRNFSVSKTFVLNCFGKQDWDVSVIVELLLSAYSNESFDTRCYNRLYKIVKNRAEDDAKETVKSINLNCKRALEETFLLDKCNENERPLLDKRLTILIEQTNYYLQALNYLDSGSAEEYVNDLFVKLSKSGAIYHSKDQFYILTYIFILDQNLLEKCMPLIFEVILSKDIKRWKQEPYRSAWMKLLEYFNTTYYKDPDRLASDKNLMKSMLQSLALQMCLYNEQDEGYVDIMLNRSMLYRYASQMNVADHLKLLDIAFSSLIGELNELPVHPRESGNTDLYANFVLNEASNYSYTDVPNVKYEGDNAILLVTNQSVMVLPKNHDKTGCDYLFADDMELWHNLQVFVPALSSDAKKVKHPKNISECKTLWGNVENSFKAVTPKKAPAKAKANVGDEVRIIFTKQLQESFAFECKIVNSDIEGSGIIRTHPDIVGYKPSRIFIKTFEENGKKLVFYASIKKILSPNEFEFEMKDLVLNDLLGNIVDNLQYSDTRVCRIVATNAQRHAAVSEDGISISVGFDNDADRLSVRRDDYVVVNDIRKGTKGFMQGEFVRFATGYTFQLEDAFMNLMRWYADHDTYDEPTSERPADVEDVQDSIMERPHIIELMYIIARVATFEQDYVKAYNYYSFCKLLAYIAGSSNRYQYFTSRQDLIELLEFFAVNEKIDEDRLKKVENMNSELISKNKSIQSSFRLLQLISFLNTENHVDELQQTASFAEDQREREIASLVLSHNYVKKAGLIQQAEDIHTKIMSLMNLQKKETDKKYYGEESLAVEFKTSLVYPENSMYMNLEQQSKKILQEICAMLNANGGTLYIGVNDQGYETGIEEDLKHPSFQGSRDKYMTYLNNQIEQILGQKSHSRVQTYFDTESKRSVLIVKVEKSDRLVCAFGEYFERMGTSAIKLKDEYLKERLKG